jgi:glycosyltransferase involved in cell wall biosynthesis
VIVKKRTLLAINNHYYRRGGAEVVFLEHNRLFQEMGWDVVPFSAKHPERFDSSWENYFIEIGEPKTLWEKLRRAPQVLYSLEASRKIAAITARVRPDIAHVHNIYHLISPSVLDVLRKRGVPVVMTLHDLKLACPNYKMLASDGICERCRDGAVWNVVSQKCIKNSTVHSFLIYLETRLHRFLDIYNKNVRKFVVPSKFFIEKFVEWGWDRERFVYIPNFVDERSFSERSPGGEDFLYVGRLSPEKGVRTMVEAVALAGVRMTIAGRGPEEDHLKDMAKRLGANIEFVGHLSAEQIRESIRNCRAVVLPSECYENAPLSILESYAGGRPVIGARIGGIPELVREGESGSTFESGSADALASSLVDFAGKGEAQLAEMGQVGRRWVETCFTLESYKERMLSLYLSELGP